MVISSCKQAMQEPAVFAIPGVSFALFAAWTLAIYPATQAIGSLRDEIVPGGQGAVPPAGLDALGPRQQRQRAAMAGPVMLYRQWQRLGKQPQRTLWQSVSGRASGCRGRCGGKSCLCVLLRGRPRA